MSTEKESGNALRGPLRLAPTCDEVEELKAKLTEAGAEVEIA